MFDVKLDISCREDLFVSATMSEIVWTYPLVNVYITIENHHVQWENSLYMAIFNSYVKLPEGTLWQNQVDLASFSKMVSITLLETSVKIKNKAHDTSGIFNMENGR